MVGRTFQNTSTFAALLKQYAQDFYFFLIGIREDKGCADLNNFIISLGITSRGPVNNSLHLPQPLSEQWQPQQTAAKQPSKTNKVHHHLP